MKGPLFVLFYLISFHCCIIKGLLCCGSAPTSNFPRIPNKINIYSALSAQYANWNSSFSFLFIWNWPCSSGLSSQGLPLAGWMSLVEGPLHPIHHWDSCLWMICWQGRKEPQHMLRAFLPSIQDLVPIWNMVKVSCYWYFHCIWIVFVFV